MMPPFNPLWRSRGAGESVTSSKTFTPFRALQPADKAGDRLRQAVHRDDWSNPQPKSRYHLVVVGAGTGGLVSAAIVAGPGARVALVERGLIRGDCLMRAGPGVACPR